MERGPMGEKTFLEGEEKNNRTLQEFRRERRETGTDHPEPVQTRKEEQ